KHGPAFAKSDGGKYRNLESKSGAIVARIAGSRLIATAVNGRYWMYFDVPDILIATSDNLVDWTPLADSAGKLVKVLTPRRGYFDRSEEHTSELQSRGHLVCRLLLEKKKNHMIHLTTNRFVTSHYYLID